MPDGARTLRRALIPNLRTAIISSSFLTAAVVLGEFTIASVLLKSTLPQFTDEYQQRRAAGRHGGWRCCMILATTALFALLTVVTRKRGMARRRHHGPTSDGTEPHR